MDDKPDPIIMKDDTHHVATRQIGGLFAQRHSLSITFYGGQLPMYIGIFCWDPVNLPHISGHYNLAAECHSSQRPILEFQNLSFVSQGGKWIIAAWFRKGKWRQCIHSGSWNHNWECPIWFDTFGRDADTTMLEIVVNSVWI